LLSAQTPADHDKSHNVGMRGAIGVVVCNWGMRPTAVASNADVNVYRLDALAMYVVLVKLP
jgi:hypothetical protein